MRMMLAILAIGLASTSASRAQQKPDFSGEWLLNAQKSDFGPIPPPQCVGLRLTHRDPEFVVEETGPGGTPCGLKTTYTTDGKPVTYTTSGVRRRATVMWLEASLVLQRVDDDGIRVRIESSLSPDGNTLVRAWHGESDQGSADWTHVYDRITK